MYQRILACLFVVVLFSVAASQEGEQPGGTLPPVVVQPPAQEPLPEIEVTSPGPSITFDLTDSFPSLSNLNFGQRGELSDNTGILRNQKSLFDTPFAASITTRQSLVEKQAPDMFHSLQNEVGVLMQATAAGQASPFVRGLTGQQVLVLVDGIRLNNSFFRRGPNQYFNTIDPGMVDHVEVLRGQGSVQWGSDAIGGVINVVTRGPDSHWGLFHGDYSSHQFTQYYNTSNGSPYSRMNVEGWVGNVGAFAGGSFMNVRDLDTGFGAFGRQPGTNYQQHAGDVKMNFLLTQDSMLTVAIQHHEQDDVIRSDKFPGFPLDRGGLNTLGSARFFMPQQRDLAYIRYQALDPLGGGCFDAITITGSYHRQREILVRGVPTARIQETDVETTGINVVATRDLDQFGKWTTGVDWYHDDVDSRSVGTGLIVPDDAYYERIGAFINWDVALTDRLDAVAGVRYELIDTGGTPSFSGQPVFLKTNFRDWVGQVGFVYEINPALHLVGSISEGFRAPNLDDLMANNPNVLQNGQSVPSLGLIPERSITYEIGLKTDSDRLRTQTYVYWTDLQENMVSVANAPNNFGTANQDSYIQGLEMDGEYLLQNGWSMYGNFWYTYGRNMVTGAPLSRVPPPQGIFGLRWRDPRLRSYFAIYTWMSRHQNRLDTVRDVTDERIPLGGTPGFATLNLRMGRTFGQTNRHRVSLSLENITDQPYQVHGSGILGTGFTARFGYTCER